MLPDEDATDFCSHFGNSIVSIVVSNRLASQRSMEPSHPIRYWWNFDMVNCFCQKDGRMHRYRLLLLLAVLSIVLAFVVVGCCSGWLLMWLAVIVVANIVVGDIVLCTFFRCAFAVCFQLLFFLLFHSWIVAIVVCCFCICCICYRCCRFIAVVPSYCSLLSVDVVCWLLFVVTCPPTSCCRSFSSIVCYPLLVLLLFLVVVVVCCRCSLLFLLVVVCCRFAVVLVVVCRRSCCLRFVVVNYLQLWTLV